MRILTILCLALVAFAANAQTITDELRHDQQGQGKVVINQSKEIEKLVNGTPAQTATPKQTVKTTTTKSVIVERTATQPQEPEKHNVTKTQEPEKHPVKTVETEKVNQKEVEEETRPEQATTHHTEVTTPAHPKTAEDETETATVNTNKKIMRHSYKTTGYRIQVYSGGNTRQERAKCEQIAQRIKASFPNLPLYVHFYSPSWKCRAGNFTNIAEARSVLKQIRAMGYKQACLVQGTINVQY